MNDSNDQDHDYEPPDELDTSGLLEELGASAETEIFLDMRKQNLELLRIATQVAGYGGSHGPLKPDEVEKAMKSIWRLYSELYSWVDPEEVEDEDEDDED